MGSPVSSSLSRSKISRGSSALLPALIAGLVEFASLKSPALGLMNSGSVWVLCVPIAEEPLEKTLYPEKLL